MPKPIAYKTGTIQPPNTARQSNILVGVGPANWGAGAANATFYNSVDSSYQYVIIKNSNPPAMWATGDFTDASLLTIINGLPDRVGSTPFTGVTAATSWLFSTGTYSMLKSEEVYPTTITSGLVSCLNPKSVNRWPNGNNSVSTSFGGARYPLYMRQESTTTVVDISNDKPYVGSTSNYALKFLGSEPYDWAGLGTKMGLESGKTYTFSFWLKSLSTTTTNMFVQTQGGSGDPNTFNVQSPNGTFVNPTTTWQRSYFTFTHTVDKYYLFFGRANNGNLQSNVGILVTEIQMEESSVPTTFKNFTDFDSPTNGGLSTGSWSLINSTGYQAWAWDGSNGGCYPFDGIDDYIRLSVTPPITTALTYTAWVYTNAFGSNNAVFNIRGTLFELNSGGLNWWSDVTGGSNGVSYSFTTGSWNFIGVTQNSNTATLYINGNQVGTATLPSINMSYGSSNSNFLGTYLGGSRLLNGKIGNAQIYNKALSPSEVENLYTATLSTYYPTAFPVNSGLVLFLDASNPNSYTSGSSTWNDISGYGSNMTLLNSPTFNSANGGFITFDNVDDYGFIDVTGGNLLGNVNISMELWIKNPVGNFIMNGAYGGYFSSGFYSGGLLKNSNGNTGPSWSSTSAWQQWVAVWDQTINQTKLYVNGTLANVSSNTYWTPATGGKLVFGGGANVNGNYSKEGSMDIGIYRFYNKVLTQSEITQNYNANKTQYGL